MYKVPEGWCRACDCVDESRGVDLSGVAIRPASRPEPADDIDGTGLGAAIAAMNEATTL